VRAGGLFDKVLSGHGPRLFPSSPAAAAVLHLMMLVLALGPSIDRSIAPGSPSIAQVRPHRFEA
jgi:hypothetical protein